MLVLVYSLKRIVHTYFTFAATFYSYGVGDKDIEDINHAPL